MAGKLEPGQLTPGDVVVYGPLGLARVERVDPEQRTLVLELADSRILLPFDSEASTFLRAPAGAEEARACFETLVDQAPDPRRLFDRLPHIKYASERGGLRDQAEILGQLLAASHTPGMPDVDTQERFAALLAHKIFEEIAHALGRTPDALEDEARTRIGARGARVPVETPLYSPPTWPSLTSDAPELDGHRLLGSFVATELVLLADPLQMDQRPGELAPGSENVLLVAPVVTQPGIWHAYVRLGTDGSLQALALAHQTRAGDLLRIARRAARHAVLGVGSARITAVDAGVIRDARVHECLRYANPAAYPWGVVHETRTTGAHLVFTVGEERGATYIEIFLAREP